MLSNISSNIIISVERHLLVELRHFTFDSMIAKLRTSNFSNREGLTSTLGGLIATARSNILGLASLLTGLIRMNDTFVNISIDQNCDDKNYLCNCDIVKSIGATPTRDVGMSINCLGTLSIDCHEKLISWHELFMIF